ncbi:MAG: VCBS repeat-containing protein [Phycisphaerae bacterium]
MRAAATSLVLAAGLLAAGCAGESGRRTVSPTPPHPVDRADALELWASPPAAVNWDDTPGPDGVQVRLYAFQVARPDPVMLSGTLEFRLYAGRVRGGDPDAEPLKVWTFAGDDLAVRRFRSLVGWGYAARLGWGGAKPKTPVVSVQAVYRPPDGPEVASAPASIAMPPTPRAGPRRSLLGRSPAAEAVARGKAGRPLTFRHQVIDADPPGQEHTFTLASDVNGDGRRDVIVGCKRGPEHLAWYENPSWQRHPMAKASGLEACAALVDVNRDGRVDVVAGRRAGPAELYWFEHPEDPAATWPRHLIENRFETWHDLAVDDLDGDGAPEVLLLADKSGTLLAYEIPAEPGDGPWPVEGRREVVSGLGAVEGLAVADLNGDGRRDVIAGPFICRATPGGKAWDTRRYAGALEVTEVATADLDGDGRQEVVACEGDRSDGRLVWFKGPAWTPHPLREGLFHPRTLAVTDFDGDARPDVLVAEMGLGRHQAPRMLLFRNLGSGRFQETRVSLGVPTYAAQAADVTGDGRTDVVGTSYDPEPHVDLWVNLGEPPNDRRPDEAPQHRPQPAKP